MLRVLLLMIVIGARLLRSLAGQRERRWRQRRWPIMVGVLHITNCRLAAVSNMTIAHDVCLSRRELNRPTRRSLCQLIARRLAPLNTCGRLLHLHKWTLLLCRRLWLARPSLPIQLLLQ